MHGVERHVEEERLVRRASRGSAGTASWASRCVLVALVVAGLVVAVPVEAAVALVGEVVDRAERSGRTDGRSRAAVGR